MPRLNPFAWGRTKLTKLWESRIDGHVISLAWSSPSSNDSLGLLAAASADGPIALFDAKTGQFRCTTSGHGFGTSSMAWCFTPENWEQLASGGQDGKIRIWRSLTTGQRDLELPAGAAWVERVACCPTAHILASAAGKKLRLWNLDGEMIREYPDHPSTIADIQWKPNDAILASAGYGKLFLWSPEQQEPVREFAWNGSMLTVAWSPDAKYIAVGGQDCTVHFWVLKTGEDLQMAGYPTKVRELAWDATSRYLATGGGPSPCVWDFAGKGPAGSTPVQLEGHKDNVTCLTYQHKGALLASGGEDGLVALWQPSRQAGSLALAKHPSAISQLAWSADDQRLAVGTADGGVVLYAV